VPERSIGTVSKTVVPLWVPWVRIPPSPPEINNLAAALPITQPLRRPPRPQRSPQTPVPSLLTRSWSVDAGDAFGKGAIRCGNGGLRRLLGDVLIDVLGHRGVGMAESCRDNRRRHRMFQEQRCTGMAAIVQPRTQPALACTSGDDRRVSGKHQVVPVPRPPGCHLALSDPGLVRAKPGDATAGRSMRRRLLAFLGESFTPYVPWASHSDLLMLIVPSLGSPRPSSAPAARTCGRRWPAWCVPTWRRPADPVPAVRPI
jgi:hypothetical protein